MVREITYILLFIWIFLSLYLSGCTGILQRPDPRKQADELAWKANFEKQWIKTSKFKFITYQKKSDLSRSTHSFRTKNSENSENIVRIYIEGDGKSYLDRMRISPDPTPHNPLALKLAVVDPRSHVVYLARPCQYMPVNSVNSVNPMNSMNARNSMNPMDLVNYMNENASDLAFDSVCRPEVWTTLRFSEPIIASMNEAIDNIKKQHQAKKIELIGFSGGAAVAALLAARRTDIEYLKTVAGDLNHHSMSEYHGTTPLSQCLNPSDPNCIEKLAALPQHHFAGEKDKIVPPFISEDFVKACQIFSQKNIKKTIKDSRKIKNVNNLKIRNINNIKRTLVKNVSHHEGWEEIWPNLLSGE